MREYAERKKENKTKQKYVFYVYTMRPWASTDYTLIQAPQLEIFQKREKKETDNTTRFEIPIIIAIDQF